MRRIYLFKAELVLERGRFEVTAPRFLKGNLGPFSVKIVGLVNRVFVCFVVICVEHEYVRPDEKPVEEKPDEALKTRGTEALESRMCCLAWRLCILPHCPVFQVVLCLQRFSFRCRILTLRVFRFELSRSHCGNGFFSLAKVFTWQIF